MSFYWWSTIISVFLSIIAFFIIKSCQWCRYSERGRRVEVPLWVLIIWVGSLFVPILGPVVTLVSYVVILFELADSDGDWKLIDKEDERYKDNIMLKILAFLDKGI